VHMKTPPVHEQVQPAYGPQVTVASSEHPAQPLFGLVSGHWQVPRSLPHCKQALVGAAAGALTHSPSARKSALGRRT